MNRKNKLPFQSYFHEFIFNLIKLKNSTTKTTSATTTTHCVNDQNGRFYFLIISLSPFKVPRGGGGGRQWVDVKYWFSAINALIAHA